MTKRDCHTIAAIIRQQREDHPRTKLSNQIYDDLTIRIADSLEAENYRFERNLFYIAAGFNAFGNKAKKLEGRLLEKD